MWTYLKRDDEGCLIADESSLPLKGTVFLAFDTFRWKVQIGCRESGGHISLMLPEINDDCNVVAWAPLSEATDPDEAVIRQHCAETWHAAINSNYAADGLMLIR